MVVRTSYGTGPYRVVDFTKDTCPSFLDSVTLFDKAPCSKPHYHLVCRKLGEYSGFYYLNGYDESLQSVWSSDYLIDCASETSLLTLIVQ